ncbi:RidA family protein [Fibrella sp. HMF5335]|uniref:RidA family protein n=1 Tax=Fibrella rubiginis TaxID=2817060 RepID=A0A939K3Q7_9BACT|nr:RidA family protein [Fibrella rubiginis]MBO0937629.1 RidA family protein [Fibrella rubiginis]
MTRQNVLSGSPWEDKMGYCRAVRIGNVIEVSGTVAIVDGTTVKADDIYAQTKNILDRIAEVLSGLGAAMSDVVRTRMFTTDVSRWEEIAQAHGAVFGSIKPVTSIYEVSALISPDYLIEIEFTAILGDR